MTPETLPIFSGNIQPNIPLVYDSLNNIHHHAARLVNQEQTDPLQLVFHLNVIKNDAIPLLKAIEHSSPELGEWVRQVTIQFGQLFCALSSY